MLTYELKKSPGVPLYEALYRCIRADILSGNLKPGQKLPSKRALAANLEVSKITVEGAYGQLLAEGYIRAEEKIGYFVEDHHGIVPPPATPAEVPATENRPLLDLSGSGTEKFPFTVWSRLQREVMLDYGEKLLLPLPAQGIEPLRRAIAEHLSAFRGMTVDPGNILIGAGTDFLYNLLIQLLGRDKVYAVEDPGYGKIRKIYAAAAFPWTTRACGRINWKMHRYCIFHLPTIFPRDWSPPWRGGRNCCAGPGSGAATLLKTTTTRNSAFPPTPSLPCTRWTAADG